MPGNTFLPARTLQNPRGLPPSAFSDASSSRRGSSHISEPFSAPPLDPHFGPYTTDEWTEAKQAAAAKSYVSLHKRIRKRIRKRAYSWALAVLDEEAYLEMYFKKHPNETEPVVEKKYRKWAGVTRVDFIRKTVVMPRWCLSVGTVWALGMVALISLTPGGWGPSRLEK